MVCQRGLSCRAATHNKQPGRPKRARVCVSVRVCLHVLRVEEKETERSQNLGKRLNIMSGAGPPSSIILIDFGEYADRSSTSSSTSTTTSRGSDLSYYYDTEFGSVEGVDPSSFKSTYTSTDKGE